MKIGHIIFAKLILSGASCGDSAVPKESTLAESSGVPPAPVIVATVQDLLNQPAKYNGRVVEVRGAAAFTFENSRLCANAEQLGPSNSESKRDPCLWLSAPGPTARFDKHYVVVVGRFDQSSHGHANCCRGRIVVTHIASTGFHGVGDIPPMPPPEDITSG